jgi:prepilin-type N-terminal cleavage/methylation domain-containing protein
MYKNFQKRIKDLLTRIRTFQVGSKSGAAQGFTLVETLVAISLLAIAIVAPMSLTTQSLVGAYYARDQVTAFFLAQEAIEAVRSVRDANVLTTALGTPTDLMTGIPSTGAAFTVDAHTVPVTMTPCPGGVCPPLQTDGELYGYDGSWTNTNFTRSVTATYVTGTGNNEIKISATVVWQTAAFEPRSFTLSENLYRWIFDTTL